MMKNKVDFRQINLLIQRYMFENWSKEVLFWSIITLFFTVLDNRYFVIFVLFISGIIYSVRLHKELMNGTNGIHFMMIPATQTEKLISNIFLNTVYHFFMILFSYSIGNVLVILLYHVILKINVPVNWDLFQVTNNTFADGYILVSSRNVFWQIFGLFAFSQAIFTLGSLYFKNNIVAKTILSFIFIGFIFFMVQLILFKFLWDIKYLSNALFPILVMINDATLPPIVHKIITIGSYITLPYLWVVSYFRLKEKEV
ncbi:MAG: hypothetical protein PHS59_07880 [Paludibacter sp.]|nr:hypothetical protein [Paludibacter sp.]